MSLMELVCPRCSRGLQPRSGQRIHACSNCGSSWEPVFGSGLVPVARELVRPCFRPEAGARLILLPVWCITVRTDALPMVADRMAPEIRVPANGVRRLPLLVEVARRLTRAGTVREAWSGVGYESESAEMDVETAFAVAESVALRHVPGWPRADDVDKVEIPLGSARLVDWPCTEVGTDLVELVGGLSIAPALVEDASPRDQQGPLAGPIAALELPSGEVLTRARS